MAPTRHRAAAQPSGEATVEVDDVSSGDLLFFPAKVFHDAVISHPLVQKSRQVSIVQSYFRTTFSERTGMGER
jgi:hypothetical protein